MRLFEISGAIVAIEDRIIEAGGEITPEIEAELNAMEGSFEEKAVAVAAVVQNLSGLADAARGEEKRIAALRKARENGADRLKRYLRDCMVVTGTKKIESGAFNIGLQASPPSVTCMLDASELPERFVRVIPETREVDKKALIDAYKAGEEIPTGVIVENAMHVRIR
jgi:hypothetical protein